MNEEKKIDGFIGQRMTYIPGAIKNQLLHDPRVNDLYLTHIGIFPKAKGHNRTRELGSSQYIFIYCIEGKGWVKIEDRLHQLRANQLIVIPPKTTCSYGADDQEPWTNYWFHYTGSAAEIFFPEIAQVINLPPIIDIELNDRLRLFEEMITHVSNPFDLDRVTYANICLKQFLSSVRYRNYYHSKANHHLPQKLQIMIDYMNINLHKNLNVDELCSISSCSASSVYKLFKSNLKASPIDYFIHLKIEKARKYLLNSPLKVKEIAHKLGYNDPYHFSRIFKQCVGVSPRQFKEEG